MLHGFEVTFHHFFNVFCFMRETFFYPSPLGRLQITGGNNTIEALIFIDDVVNENVGLTDTSAVRSPALRECINQLDAYFTGTNLEFTVMVTQPGTSFQQKIWLELMNIPCGNTASYLELSKKIGNVKAIRAVGTANGKNNIAILVPCHRVIGSNGNLVGYAGGLWRKKWLLEHEAKFVNGVNTLF
jgi:methylated-DNA-[protein]-cysteine S-methyltransferase